MNLKKKIKSIEAEKFIRNHPATSYPIDGCTVDICRYIACKNGYFKTYGGETVTVYSDEEDYDKWRKSKYFDPEDVSGIDPDPSVDVPYEVYFGYPWKAEKVIYDVDVCWLLYMGDSYNVPSYCDKNYQRFQGKEMSADSYEESWIIAADWVKENLGDFDEYDFYTDEENISRKTEDIFIRTERDGSGHYPLVENPLRKTPGSQEINNRWFKWFITTDKYKKDWVDNFEDDNGCFNKFYNRLIGAKSE